MRRKILPLLTAAIFIIPLLVVPLTIDYYNPPKELLAQLVGVTCLAMWLIHGIIRGRLEIAPNRLYFFLVLFCAISGLSLVWAPSRYLAMRDLAQFLSYMAIFFVCVNVVHVQKEAISIAAASFGAGVIAALYAIFQHFGLDFINYPGVVFADWRFKLYSTFGNPDFLANYLAMVFPVGISLYLLLDKFLKKLLLLLALAAVYYALMITFSIGAFIGLAAALTLTILLMLFEWIRFKNFVSKKGMASSLVALILVLAAFSTYLPAFISRANLSQAWRHGLDNRIMAYRAAYRMMKDQPVRGVGIGNFKFRFPEYMGRYLKKQPKFFDSAQLDKERHLNVHNDFAQIWVETGIFGALVFGLILLLMLKDGVSVYLDCFEYKKKLLMGGLLCGLAAYLAHAAVSFPMHVVPNALAFWALAGLLFSQAFRQNTSIVILNLSSTQKSFFKVGAAALAVLLCVWPAKNYLSEVFLKRMVVLDSQGRIDKALAEARTALFFNPDSNAVIYTANYAFLAKDYDNAIEAYRQALKNSDEINYHVALAEAYYDSGMKRQCLAEYRRALLLNPCSWQIRYRLASLYAEMEMDAEAQSECEYLMVNFPKSGELKDKLRPILSKITERRFLAVYGAVQNKK
jgi:O-antigen ligase